MNNKEKEKTTEIKPQLKPNQAQLGVPTFGGKYFEGLITIYHHHTIEKVL